MKFSEEINDGLVEKINQIAGTTANTYSYANKASDVNAALDRYLALAFKADGQWTFDDINQSSPPIDTQNIVSGTNRYKIGTFTEKILNLILLECLDADAKGIYLEPETFADLRAQGYTFEEKYLWASKPTGNPMYYLKYGDFIYLYPTPNYSETSGLKAYFNRPASKFSFVSFTVTIATPGVFTATAHGLAANDILVMRTSGALPTGLAVDTKYYVISTGLTADAFQVSTSQGGSAVNTSGTQSGTHSFLKTSKEAGIPQIHHPYLYRYAAAEFLRDKNPAKLTPLLRQIQIDEADIIAYFGGREKDTHKVMTTEQIQYR